MAGLELFANQASTSVSSGGTTAPAAGTSQTWTVSSSSGFPAASSTASPPTFFRITDPALSSEKMIVTNVSGTTWTVTRGTDGTTPVAHSSGFSVQNVVTAAAIEALIQAFQVGLLMPSGDETGVTDATSINNAVTAMPATGGIIRLSPVAPWYIECGQVVINQSGVYIDTTACLIYMVGSGDGIDMHDSSVFLDRTVHGGGILGFGVFDGTNTTGNATALHVGDIFEMALDFRVQNFTAGTTSSGAHLDNRYYWTEQAYGRVFAENCTTGVLFDVSAANTTNTGSFMRCNLDLNIDQGTATQNGVTLQNGAFIQDGVLGVHGNFITSGTTVTSAVLVLNGSTPSGTAQSDISNISDSVINIGTELSPGDDFAPYTVYFGTTDNYVASCTGNIDFGADAAFTSSNNAGQWTGFVGVIFGDPALPAALAQGSTNVADSAQTISAVSSSPAAVGSISVPVASYTAYRVRLYIPYSSTKTAGTPTFLFTGPAWASGLASFNWYYQTNATPFRTGGTTNAGIAASAPTMLGPTLSTATTLALVGDGVIVFSSAGTLGLSAYTSATADTFSVNLGAYIEILPLSAP